MLLYAFLNLTAAAVLGAALLQARKLDLPSGPALRRVRLLAVASAVLVFLAALAAVGMLVQGKSGLNLALPGTVKTDARQWLDARKANPPNRSMPGTNLRIIAAAVDFYESHNRSMPPEAASKLGPLTLIETKPKRVMTLREEADAFSSAQLAWGVMESLAEAQTPSPAGPAGAKPR
jgi:hypothetical protein